MRPVTIGIDARTFYYADSIARGIGHYSRYHLQAIVKQCPEWRFICFSEWENIPKVLEFLIDAPNVSFCLVDDYVPDMVDILHICDPMSLPQGFDSPFRIFKGSNKITVTFYDLIPLHFYFSSWSEQHRNLYLLRLEQFCKSTAVALTISAFTGSDLIREKGISPDRVKVIMAGLNASTSGTRPDKLQVTDALNRLGITKPFFLHVGALDPHKNFDASAAAFVACREQATLQLVVVGEKAGALAGYEAFCREQNITDIVFTGFISREDLEIVYQEAVALLFMSKFEGFGFPVLEAMAKGCPVITSNVTSIPEVAGDAAIMLAPDDIAGIRNAMLGLLKNPELAEGLRQKGFQQAAQFTWQNTAEKTIAVWDQMLSDSQKSRKVATSAGKVQNRPHVLFDISVLGLSRLYESAKTGVFRVVENLACGLAASPDIKVSFCSTQHLSEHAPATIRACQEYLAESPELKHIPFFPNELPAADIFHSPFHALPDSTSGFRRFLTVCDIISLLHPEMFQGKAVNSLPRILASLRPDDQLLCISHATKQDICHHLTIAPERAFVTHLAANPDTFYRCNDTSKINLIRNKYGIPADTSYLLCLGTLEPRKNVELVIRTFVRLAKAGLCQDLVLVLIGTKGWGFDAVIQEIEGHTSLHNRFILAGFVPDSDLAALYSGAMAFAYMSRYEGFGLPPLEAMQCGIPVITSNTSSLPEVMGDAGIMLDPDDQDGLYRSILELYHNESLRRFLSIQSVKQASMFSWDKCVRQTIAAYKSALPHKDAR